MTLQTWDGGDLESAAVRDERAITTNKRMEPARFSDNVRSWMHEEMIAIAEHQLAAGFICRAMVHELYAAVCAHLSNMPIIDQPCRLRLHDHVASARQKHFLSRGSS